MITFTLASAGRGKLHQGAQFLAFGFPSSGSPPAPVPQNPAVYRLLAPAYVNTLLPAGSIVTEGVEIPFGYPPNATTEPLNHQGLINFRNAGPQLNLGDFFPASSFKLTPPATFWTIQNGHPVLVTPLS